MSIVFSLEPPCAIRHFVYYCDNQFHTRDLYPLYQTYEANALIFITGSQCKMYRFNDVQYTILKSVDVKLQNHQGRGGQSQNRIARLADESHFNYITKMNELAVGLYITDANVNVTNIIICGCAGKKHDLYERLDPRLKVLVRDVITVNDTIGSSELHTLGLQIVNGVNLLKYDATVMHIYDMISSGKDDVLVYGDEILTYIKNQILQRLIICRELFETIKINKDDIKCEVLIIEPISEITTQFRRDFGGWIGIKYHASEHTYIEHDEDEDDDDEDIIPNILTEDTNDENTC